MAKSPPPPPPPQKKKGLIAQKIVHNRYIFQIVIVKIIHVVVHHANQIVHETISSREPRRFFTMWCSVMKSFMSFNAHFCNSPVGFNKKSFNIREKCVKWNDWPCMYLANMNYNNWVTITLSLCIHWFLLNTTCIIFKVLNWIELHDKYRCQHSLMYHWFIDIYHHQVSCHFLTYMDQGIAETSQRPQWLEIMGMCGTITPYITIEQEQWEVQMP